MKTNNKETIIFICACHSFDHQIIFSVVEIESLSPEMIVSVHLKTYKNIFKRIWVAVKYVFGYKSKYGDWDEFIFKMDDLEDLKNFLSTNLTKIQ